MQRTPNTEVPMAKPLVIAKREGPEWSVAYIDKNNDTIETMSIYGSPTIEDALKEARASLDATHSDWYTITGAELVEEYDEEPLDEDEP
jgi:hypothetical protein